MIGKRNVLRRFRKTVRVGAKVTSGGKLFQRLYVSCIDLFSCKAASVFIINLLTSLLRRLPATGNARSPTVAAVYVGSPAVKMTTTLLNYLLTDYQLPVLSVECHVSTTRICATLISVAGCVLCNVTVSVIRQNAANQVSCQ